VKQQIVVLLAIPELGVVHTWKPSTPRAEAGRSQGPGDPPFFPKKQMKPSTVRYSKVWKVQKTIYDVDITLMSKPDKYV
jgi:hypothetical protein